MLLYCLQSIHLQLLRFSLGHSVYVQVSNLPARTPRRTHSYVPFQLCQPTNELVMEVLPYVERGGQVEAGCLWPHGNKAVPERLLVGNCQCLVDPHQHLGIDMECKPYLIVACNKLGDGMQNPLSFELLWTFQHLECPVKFFLLLCLWILLGFLELPPYGSRYSMMIHRYLVIHTALLVDLIVLSYMHTTARIPAHMKCLSLPFPLHKTVIAPVTL